jgi:hypothetical protein
VGSDRLGRQIATAAAVLAALLLPALAGASRTATPPSAATGPVTAIGSTTATLTGSVDPNGTATSWHFEYGTTTSYGSQTASTGAGAGTASINVSATLTGLSPGTTYDYALVATSTAGTTPGLNGIFTTAAATAEAPTVVTSPASSVTSTSATLGGTVNPNGRATTYSFEYGKTTGYGSTTPAQNAGSGTSAVNVGAAITGLQSGQTYHFRLDATSDAGTSHGADMAFTATAAPAGGAPAVTTKAATSITTSSAKLNGSVNPHGQSTTWDFQFGPTTSYGSETPVANVGAGTKAANVSATVNGLPSGLYHFRLVATNASGTTYGKDLTFGSGAPVVQTGTTQGAGTSTATLTGTVNPVGNATSWYFEYGTTTAYGSKTPSRNAGSGTSPTGVSAAVSKLQSGTTYHYRLVAASGAGTAYGSDVTFSTISAVTLSASTTESIYGHVATLSGMVATRQANVGVTIRAQALGAASFATVGSVQTGAGGVWSYRVRPRIATAYEASTTDGTSSPVSVGVRPAISLRLITKARFTTRVVASRSFAHRKVQLQRQLASGKWVTVAHARLNAKSSAIFAARLLPQGASTIRIAMSVNQAGAGFLGGFSRTLTYKRA